MQERLYDLKQDATFLSNCFDISLLQKIQSGEVEVCESENGFICVEKKLGVNWLYYFLVYPYSFNINVDFPLFINLIYTKNKNVESFKKALNGLGFRLQREYCLLEKVESKMNLSGGGGIIDYAQSCEKEEIEKILNACFDKVLDEIPSSKVLEDFIKLKQVLVAKDGGEILGVLVFSVKRVISIVESLCVKQSCRAKGIGSMLLNKYLFLTQKTQQKLWVRADNIKARGLYTKYGFVFSGQVNAVWVRENAI